MIRARTAAQERSIAAEQGDQMPRDPKAEKPADATPPQEAIAKRAYELYLQRGSVPGYELEDWLAAEAELTAAAATGHRTNGRPSDRR
jgi:hypothetical protein